MKRVRKIILLFTLCCYSAASSVASAHGYSSFNYASGDSIDSELIMADEAMGMDCHSPETQFDDNSSAATCQIFCSVMAQAMTETNHLIDLDVKPFSAGPSFLALVRSRQLAVETHPPK